MSWLTTLQRPLPAFAAASFLAVVTGAVVCALSGVPAGVWGRNLAAWIVGALAAVALSRWAGGRTLRAIAVLTPLGVAAALLFRGQDGVHRWLDLGPVLVNAAMLLLPAAVVALVVLAERAAVWWIPALVTLAVLVAQPDASQATAFALALGVAATGLRTQPLRFRVGVAVVALLLAAVAWTRPDPLAPVAEVEGVIQLAERLSPLLAALAMLALAAFAGAPAWATRANAGDLVRCAGYALSALFLGWCLAPAFGAFPVPLVGVGLSPILGAWLGVGVLAAVAQRTKLAPLTSSTAPVIDAGASSAR